MLFLKGEQFCKESFSMPYQASSFLSLPFSFSHYLGLANFLATFIFCLCLIVFKVMNIL